MDAAKSEYLMFCDHDDVWLSNKIETSLNRMEEAEAIYGVQTPILVHTDLAVVDDKLTPLFPSLSRQEGLSSGNSNFRQLIMQNNVTGCTMLLNKTLYQMARPIPRNAAMHDWWIALVAAAFGKVIFMEVPTVLYRQHAQNSVGIGKRRTWLDQLLRLWGFFRGQKDGRARLIRVTNQAEEFKNRFETSLTATRYILVRSLATLWSMSIGRRLWILIYYRLFAFRLTRTIELLVGACGQSSGKSK